MNKQAVIGELSAMYPGKPIKELPGDDCAAIVCEFDPAESHPEWSLAVVVIDRLAPHYHRNTTEVYHVIRGALKLRVDDDELDVFEGQQFTIIPGKVHSATGDETWVEVYCTPGHLPEDYIMIE